MTIIRYDIEQGSDEWLELRRTKITATDACAIMGASPWKTRAQLLEEKAYPRAPDIKNKYMVRGLELEEPARQLFTIKTGIHLRPAVAFSDDKSWIMASLDGIDMDCETVLEIKCPGKADHAKAVAGKVPNKYYPQLQHQMFVCIVSSMFYFSFDGFDGDHILVLRDDEYIKKMLEEEEKFYHEMIALKTAMGF